MAGGSSSVADTFNSNKPAKGTTEKKKRKRPSKKVPTTVVEASSNNFMNLVQKLTGSADELSHYATGGSAAQAKSTSPSPYPSPYSSPSNQTTPHAEEPPPQQQSSYYQQYANSAMDDDSGSSHNYNNSYNAAPTYSSGSYSYNQAGHYAGYDNYVSYAGGSGSSSRGNVDQDDLYQQGSYSGRYNNSSNDTSDHVSYSRAMENDISPFSWRDPMNQNSTSDYWYHVDPAMRAS